MTEPSDHTWKGDTWWMTDKECGECDEKLSTNGKIYKCYGCGFTFVRVDRNR